MRCEKEDIRMMILITVSRTKNYESVKRCTFTRHLRHSYGGGLLLRRPTYSFNVGAQYTGWSRGYAGFVVNYVGNRDDRDFSAFPAPATPVVLPPYTTVDLSAQLNNLFTPALSGSVRVLNLFDERYQEAFGFLVPGRTIFVGVKATR